MEELKNLLLSLSEKQLKGKELNSILPKIRTTLNHEFTHFLQRNKKISKGYKKITKNYMLNYVFNNLHGHENNIPGIEYFITLVYYSLFVTVLNCFQEFSNHLRLF